MQAIVLLAMALLQHAHAQGAAAAEEAHADLIEPFLGCWDDQFTGNADSTLLVGELELVVSYAAGSPPLTFTALTNYTTTFETGADDRVGLSVIAANDPNDQWSAGKFSDFDMMLVANDMGTEQTERLLYCQIDYDDPSAAEASKPEGPPEIDYSNAAAGCNGYPWSEMRRSVGGRCKPDGTDDDVTSVAAVLAAKNTMALFGLACLVGFGVSL